MAENHLVRCSVKQQNRVTHIGGTNSDGTSWKMSEQDALQGIRNGKLKFYVTVDSKGVWLGASQEQGRDVLKPVGEGSDPSLLLHLPDCP
jgi:hypothetical protein